MIKRLSQADKSLIKVLREKQATGNQTEISPINNQSLLYYNSVNLAVGKQGSGKSLLFLREIMNIQNEKNIHLFIYVTPNGDINDSTMLAIKPCLTVPLLVVAEEDLQEVVEGIVNLKNIYNDMVRDGMVDKLDPEQKQEILSLLHLDEFPSDMYNTRLHTLLLFDDAAFSSLFKKDDSFFNKFITRCRHNNFIVMFATQKFKGLSMPVKSQATTVMIYKGFTPQEVSYIFHNATINGFSYQEFKDLYARLEQDQVLYCNSQSGQMRIIDLSHIRALVHSVPHVQTGH